MTSATPSASEYAGAGGGVDGWDGAVPGGLWEAARRCRNRFVCKGLRMLLVRHCFLFAVLMICVYTELAHGKLYNWSTLPAAFAGLLINFALGGLWDGGWRGANLGTALIAMGLVLLIFGWPYMRGGISAGDLKLMVAVAAIGGLHNMFIVTALFYTALVGLLMAVLVLIWRGSLWAGVKGAFAFTFVPKRKGAGQKAPESRITVPYGVAIAVGSVLAWYLVELPGS